MNMAPQRDQNFLLWFSSAWLHKKTCFEMWHHPYPHLRHTAAAPQNSKTIDGNQDRALLSAGLLHFFRKSKLNVSEVRSWGLTSKSTFSITTLIQSLLRDTQRWWTYKRRAARRARRADSAWMCNLCELLFDRFISRIKDAAQIVPYS